MPDIMGYWFPGPNGECDLHTKTTESGLFAIDCATLSAVLNVAPAEPPARVVKWYTLGGGWLSLDSINPPAKPSPFTPESYAAMQALGWKPIG